MILGGDVGGTKANLGLFEGLSEAASEASADPEAARPLPYTGSSGAASSGSSASSATTAEVGAMRPVRAIRAIRLVAASSFACAEFNGLAEVVEAFLRQQTPAAAAASAAPAGRRPVVTAACFGVAGPVLDNRSSTPNLAWEIDGAALASDLGIPAVQLVNDLVATAEGIALLAESELLSLQEGGPAPDGAPLPLPPQGPAHAAAPEAGNQALIAAGTGLGMALLPVIDGVRVTVPSEGGHADYAPRDADEAALLLGLRRRFGEHVSTERVVSGRGLLAIYEHLRDSGAAAEDPATRAALAAGDPARVIADTALAGADALCGRALDMFVAAYGAAAGNLALLGTATGGVYIGGGIAPKILPRLSDGRFVRAFLDKGRFEGYLRRIPVRVLLNDRTAMLGAARRAAGLDR